MQQSPTKKKKHGDQMMILYYNSIGAPASTSPTLSSPGSFCASSTGGSSISMDPVKSESVEAESSKDPLVGPDLPDWETSRGERSGSEAVIVIGVVERTRAPAERKGLGRWSGRNGEGSWV